MLSRLLLEQNRLFGMLGHAEGGAHQTHVASPACAYGLVLSVGKPAEWAAVLPVWTAFQSELGLPAPGIAVDGVDAYQLWFSVPSTVPVSQGMPFLQQLVARYLPGMASSRVRCLLPADTTVDDAAHAWVPVPASRADGGPWSAFVTPDLARIFEAEPWLEREPSADAQADLLSRLQPASVHAFQHALMQLGVGRECSGGAHARTQVPNGGPTGEGKAVSTGLLHGKSPTGDVSFTHPLDFLRHVMNDPTVDMRVRVDAACAILRHTPQS